MKIKLGDKAKDTITGFIGTVTERNQAAAGPMLKLEPPVGPTGEYRDPHWFEEKRVEPVEPA